MHCLWSILTSCVLKFILVQLDLNKIKTLREKCLSHCLRSFIDFPYIFSLCCVKQTTTRKKQTEKKYFVGMYSKCVFMLKQGYSSHLNKEKNCLLCLTCFCTLLDCFSGSVIFFDLEKFYNTKLKSSTERFNQINRNSQPHLLYSPSWLPLCMDLDPLAMSITNKPFFRPVNC